MRSLFFTQGISFIYMILQLKNLIIDGDTFWAIKVGEWIWINKQVPEQDTFSWTVNGNAWVAHEWLYDLMIYKLYASFNYYGIILIVFIAVSIIMFLLWKLYDTDRKNKIIKLIIFLIVIFMIKSFIVARPQTYGYMFFLYFLHVLVNEKRLLWTLPLVTVVWANMHGSVILGIAMLCLQLFYEIIFHYVKNKKFFMDKTLFLVTLLVPLSSLINPYGIRLWKTAFLLISNEIYRQISEWQPPKFDDLTTLVMYLLLILTTVFVCFFKRDFNDTKRLLLISIYLAGTFYEAITHIRFFPYLAISWGLFVLTLIPEQLFSEQTWNKKISAVLLILLPICVFSAGKIPQTIDDVIDKKKWPVEAISRLEQGNTFNDYRWGGYLIFKDKPVFIDGRADVYYNESEVFQDYVDITSFNKEPIGIFNKYCIEQVIIPVNTPLDIYLKKMGWPEKFRDETAVIYLKS